MRSWGPTQLRIANCGLRIQEPKSAILILAAACGLLLSSGCGIGSARKKPWEVKLDQVTQEKAAVTRDLEECKAEGFQLREQIKALSAIPADKRVNPLKLVPNPRSPSTATSTTRTRTANEKSLSFTFSRMTKMGTRSRRPALSTCNYGI